MRSSIALSSLSPAFSPVSEGRRTRPLMQELRQTHAAWRKRTPRSFAYSFTVVIILRPDIQRAVYITSGVRLVILCQFGTVLVNYQRAAFRAEMYIQPESVVLRFTVAVVRKAYL